MKYKLAFFFARIYWFLLKPHTGGANLLLIKKNKIVLVKPVYRKNFELPGGGFKGKELPIQTMKREVLEELGMHIKHAKLFGVYRWFEYGKRDIIVTFISSEKFIESKLKPQNEEIEKIETFDLNHLPENISRPVLRRIKEYKSGNYPATGQW